MKILVTGGAGYIGSHTVVELLQQNYDVIVIDNLCNSSEEALRRVKKITGKPVTLIRQDVADKPALSRIFDEHDIEAVIHFAGLKAVGESVTMPLAYYRNNIDSTLSLCEVMQEHGVKKLIFSSSATVYGTPEELPLKETDRVGLGITNPYGQTKYMIEQILKDISLADPAWHTTILRYFNPIGAHPSGLIGEDPNGIPNNLMPFISQVAVGKLGKLKVYGSDYPTPDGTGVRDYIHVVDLAKGHLAALKHLGSASGLAVYNLGTGQGTSVLEAIRAFEKASGKTIPYEIAPRRPGDIATCYADATKAHKELGWQTKLILEEACRDTWNWQRQNPNGF